MKNLASCSLEPFLQNAAVHCCRTVMTFPKVKGIVLKPLNVYELLLPIIDENHYGTNKFSLQYVLSACNIRDMKVCIIFLQVTEIASSIMHHIIYAAQYPESAVYEYV